MAITNTACCLPLFHAILTMKLWKVYRLFNMPSYVPPFGFVRLVLCGIVDFLSTNMIWAPFFFVTRSWCRFILLFPFHHSFLTPYQSIRSLSVGQFFYWCLGPNIVFSIADYAFDLWLGAIFVVTRSWCRFILLFPSPHSFLTPYQSITSLSVDQFFSQCAIRVSSLLDSLQLWQLLAACLWPFLSSSISSYWILGSFWLESSFASSPWVSTGAGPVMAAMKRAFASWSRTFASFCLLFRSPLFGINWCRLTDTRLLVFCSCSAGHHSKALFSKNARKGSAMANATMPVVNVNNHWCRRARDIFYQFVMINVFNSYHWKIEHIGVFC